MTKMKWLRLVTTLILMGSATTAAEPELAPPDERLPPIIRQWLEDS